MVSQESREFLSIHVESITSLMELNSSIISAICQCGEYSYKDKIKAMQAAGLSDDAILGALDLHQNQLFALLVHLANDTMCKMLSAVENSKPVFDKADTAPLTHVYSKFESQLILATKKLHDQYAIANLTEAYELLAEVSHEVDARRKKMRARRNMDVARVFSGEVRSAPFAREVRVAVDFSEDLSFLDEKTWSKRVVALRQCEQARFSELSDEWKKSDPNKGVLQAADRHIVNTLKGIPRVRNYLHRSAN